MMLSVIGPTLRRPARADHPQYRFPGIFVEMFCATHRLPALYEGTRMVVPSCRLLQVMR